MMNYELPLLQTMRFKGRADLDMLTASSGLEEESLQQHLQELLEGGFCQEASGRYRLTPEGREQLQTLQASEQRQVNQTRLRELYEAFIPINTSYKKLINQWQMRDGAPNDHSDSSYDNQVIEQIVAEHQNLKPLLDRLISEVARLKTYATRFDAALTKVKSGDHAWLTRPLMDSHHTVWFEFHEDLIVLAGHSREAEAKAGRAD